MNLPPELVYVTLMELPVEDILKYCQTSRTVMLICQDEHFWLEKARTELMIPLHYFRPDLSWPERFPKAHEALLLEQYAGLADEMAKYILPDLLKRLEELNVGSPRIYFTREGDSNQSEFEQKSNHLKVGAIANNELVGRALLRFTRYFVDTNFYLFSTDIYNDLGEGKFTLDGIIQYLHDSEETYGSNFGLEETFRAVLSGYEGGQRVEEVIENTLAHVDKILVYSLCQFILKYISPPPPHSASVADLIFYVKK